MSNNIYNILGKLNALTPKQEEAKPAERIYESVEARGSMLEGVAKVEKKLSEQYAAMKEASYVHKGTYGTEYQGDADDEEETQRQADKGTRKRGRPAKAGKKPVKKNPTGQRGRPKKADSDKSMAHLPWGGKPPKVDLNPTKKWPKDKTTVHKMESAKPDFLDMDKDGDKKEPMKKAVADKKVKNESIGNLEQRFNALLESRIVDESGETLQHTLNRFKAEVKKFEKTSELDSDLYEALFDYYSDAGEMPYGVAKARTGDPFQWVTARLRQDLNGGQMPLVPTIQDEAVRPEDIPAVQRKAAGKDFPASLDQVYDTSDKISHRDTLAQNNGTKGLDELARLAGITTESKFDPEKFGSDGAGNGGAGGGDVCKDGDEMEEGNEFSGALAKAKAAGKEEFEVDNKTYKVKESLADIMSLAGIATEGKDYGDTDVEEAPEYANSPDEEVSDVDAIVHQGDDLNKEKKQDPETANKAANTLTAKESVDPLAGLGRRLMKAYESIKIAK